MTTMGPLHLYRSLLRHANGMKDYNFRMYAQRRVKAGFQKNRNLQGYVGLFGWFVWLVVGCCESSFGHCILFFCFVSLTTHI